LFSNCHGREQEHYRHALEVEDFMKQRKFLHNVSFRTIDWYEQSFKWLGRSEPTESGTKAFVIGMREDGLKAIFCNSRIRVANAYFRWAGLPVHIQSAEGRASGLAHVHHRAVLPAHLLQVVHVLSQAAVSPRMTLFDSGLRIE
jgi:hypothetical protein